MYKLFFGLSMITASMLLVFVSGCKNNSSSPTAPSYGNSSTTNTISMSGNAFSPSSLTVPVHTTITWNNNSGAAHTSTSDTGVWDTGNIPVGSSKQTTFDAAGTYHYHCAYHSYMTGVIYVQ